MDERTLTRMRHAPALIQRLEGGDASNRLRGVAHLWALPGEQGPHSTDSRRCSSRPSGLALHTHGAPAAQTEQEAQPGQRARGLGTST